MNHRGRGRGRGAGGPPRGNGPAATPGSSARGNGRGGRGGPPRYKNSLDADLDREVQGMSRRRTLGGCVDVTRLESWVHLFMVHILISRIFGYV